MFASTSLGPSASPQKAPKGPGLSPNPKSASPGKGSPTSSTTSPGNRPKWNSSPLRNPPGNLRGVTPVTKEPWQEVAKNDIALRMEFGSRYQLGLPEYAEQNGLKDIAKEKRKARAGASAWNESVVKHSPPVLRGQKILRRAEPWSSYHNDDISELNAVDGTSINELYAVTADRGDGPMSRPKKPTIVQPKWDNSMAFGKRAHKPGGDERAHMRAATFREQRRAGTRAGAAFMPAVGAAGAGTNVGGMRAKSQREQGGADGPPRR